DRAALDHAANDIVTVDFDDGQRDLSIVDEQPVPGGGILGQALIGRRYTIMIADDLRDRDAHGLAGAPFGLPPGELAEPDLGPLQVRQHADRPTGPVRRGPHPFVGEPVIVVPAVAEIQPGDVHPGIDKSIYMLLRRCGRPQGANNLRASSHASQPTGSPAASGPVFAITAVTAVTAGGIL